MCLFCSLSVCQCKVNATNSANLEQTLVVRTTAELKIKESNYWDQWRLRKQKMIFLFLLVDRGLDDDKADACQTAT